MGVDEARRLLKLALTRTQRELIEAGADTSFESPRKKYNKGRGQTRLGRKIGPTFIFKAKRGL